MKRFQQFLRESLNSPYRYRWNTIHERNWTGQFTTKDKDIVDVIFDWNGEDSWYLLFKITSQRYSYGNSNRFDALRVLSTIIAMLKEFQSDVNPKSILFTGDKEEGKDKLYLMMAEHFKKELSKRGYKIKVQDKPSTVVITLIKKDSVLEGWND